MWWKFSTLWILRHKIKSSLSGRVFKLRCSLSHCFMRRKITACARASVQTHNYCRSPCFFSTKKFPHFMKFHSELSGGNFAPRESPFYWINNLAQNQNHLQSPFFPTYYYGIFKNFSNNSRIFHKNFVHIFSLTSEVAFLFMHLIATSLLSSFTRFVA